jgi:hypothetical protein
MRADRSLLFSFGFSLFLAPSLANAVLAQRTFVASNGSDADPCSITAPCRKFAVAISKPTDGGEVIVQDSAGYGPVTITKSISIIAPAGVYAGVTVSSGDGITINAPGAIVVLRGLSINGQGGANGILAQAASRVRVESCVVSNMGPGHLPPGEQRRDDCARLDRSRQRRWSCSSHRTRQFCSTMCVPNTTRTAGLHRADRRRRRRKGDDRRQHLHP